MQKRIIVVVKKSTWEQLQSNGGFEGLAPKAVKRAREVHRRHQRSVQLVLQTLAAGGDSIKVVEGPEKAFRVLDAKMVVTVGGDGTFLSASHRVPTSVPIIGVNSDPETSRGCLCSATSDTLIDVIMGGRRVSITRLQVMIDGELVSNRVLNEALFTHACPAAMTKFVFTCRPDTIRYGCSGIWIGTGAGSTGAMRSAGGQSFPLTHKKLQAIIREPYLGFDGQPGRQVFEGRNIKLISKIDKGVIYLDGPFLKHPVSYEQRIDFSPSTDPLTMIQAPERT